MVGSSSGLGRLPFPVTNRGSNPLPTTNNMARSSTGLVRETDGQQNDSKVGYEKVPILSSRDLMFRTSNFSVRKQSVRILYGLQNFTNF
jgi:hypothetical protein